MAGVREENAVERKGRSRKKCDGSVGGRDGRKIRWKREKRSGVKVEVGEKCVSVRLESGGNAEAA